MSKRKAADVPSSGKSEFTHPAQQKGKAEPTRSFSRDVVRMNDTNKKKKKKKKHHHTSPGGFSHTLSVLPNNLKKTAFSAFPHFSLPPRSGKRMVQRRVVQFIDGDDGGGYSVLRE
ncbi:hypothetical protein F2P81_022563 [Scophthalmus maximus]|uniref:Uncharacterized protein n=1 Tax=Scophthalmus maximus TaxID=52904 RepID=A0A6A4S2X2_SCOMX|nr:hypothetical protein F2P81_022563 [Scophthalmus maximus]